MWRRKIGDQAFAHIGRRSGLPDQGIVAVLDAAVEVGFGAPEVAPRIDPAGTATLWPGGNVITPEGLAKFYQHRGHGILGFRLGPLLRGVGQLLLPRLQEVASAYEQQCAAERVSPPPCEHLVFVGGTAHDPVELLTLRNLSGPLAPAQRATARRDP